MTRRRKWLLGTLGGIVLLVVLVVGAVSWVLTTSSGARLLLGRVQGLLGEGARLEGVEGRIGGLLRIATIELSRPDLYVLVRDFEIDTSPMEPLRGLLHIYRLGAKSVEVRTASSEAAARIPLSFKPPYALRIDAGAIGELRVGKLTAEAQAEKDLVRRRALMTAARDKDFVVKDIFLKGEGSKHAWKIDEARVETTYGKASLAGTLGTDSPFPLDATLDAAGAIGERPYLARATLKGKLAAIDVQAEGTLSGQRATLRATLEPFSKVPVRTLQAQARDVDLSRFSTAPRTRLSLDAQLAAAGAGYAGPVKIVNAEPGRWDRQLLPFEAASARVAVGAERVDVADLAVSLLGGGAVSGRASLTQAGVEADLRVAGVDLAALHVDLQKTRVAGTIAVKGNSAAQRFELALKDPRFDIEGRGGLGNDRLEMETVRIRTGGGAVTAKGGMALKGRKEFRFEGRAEHFDPAAFVKTPPGDLNFAFTTSGALADGIAGEALVEIAPSRFAGQSASGRIAVAGDRTRIASADALVDLGEARIAAKGSFGRPGDAMEVSVRAPNVAALAKPFGVALSGRVEADARLIGTFASPAGRVSLTGANLGLPGGIVVKELAFKAQAGVEADSPIDATVQARGISGGKDGTPKTYAESLDATLKGTRRAHRLDLDARLSKDNSMRLALQGGLDPRARAPSWSGRIETLALSGRGAFALAAPAPLTASADVVELGDATLKGEWGEARLAQTRWTPRSLDVKGSSGGIQVQNLARSLRIGSVPRSTLVVAGDWDIHAAETFEGTVNLRRVSGDLRIGEPPLPLGLQALELRMEAVRGRAKAVVNIVGDRIGRIQGDGTGLIARDGAGWTFAKDAPLDARLVADIPDLATIAPWLGPEARAGGRLTANIVVAGTGADPRISGEARAENLALREPQTGFELEQGQLAVRLTGKSLAIEQFTAVTPWRPVDAARAKLAGIEMPAAGKLTAEGAIDLAGNTGVIRIRATQVPVTQLQTRFLAMSGEAQLQATAEGVLATGAFKADAGWIGALEAAPPSVSDDVVVVRSARAAAVEAKARQKEALRIDARFTLGNSVYFEGRGLDTRLTGDLRIVGDPSAGLRATGTIRTLGGTYKGYGQRLAIERGVLQFAGPVDNPTLNVLATRKGLPVEAGVEVAGSVARPRVRLVSSPDVPEPEKLSWLVLGRGPSELGPGDASVLVAAAASILGKGDGTDIGKKLGFDEVRIGRADSNSVLGVLPQSTVAGRTGTASAAEVVSVGKRLGRNLHLTYEQGLADAEGALKITYTVSQKFQVLVRAGFLPGLDAVYRWTFP